VVLAFKIYFVHVVCIQASTGRVLELAEIAQQSEKLPLKFINPDKSDAPIGKDPISPKSP